MYYKCFIAISQCTQTLRDLKCWPFLQEVKCDFVICYKTMIFHVYMGICMARWPWLVLTAHHNKEWTKRVGVSLNLNTIFSSCCYVSNRTAKVYIYSFACSSYHNYNYMCNIIISHYSYLFIYSKYTVL